MEVASSQGPLEVDDPHKTDDVLLPGVNITSDDDITNAYSKEDSREDPQDDEDVYPGSVQRPKTG